MNKFFSFSAFLIIIAALLTTSCSSSSEKEAKGYTFNKEFATTEPFEIEELTGSITVDIFFVLHEYPTSWTTVITKHESGTRNEFLLRIRDKNFAQWLYGDGKNSSSLGWTPGQVLPLNQKVRLTVIRNIEERVMSLYIDGVLVEKKEFETLENAASTNSRLLIAAQGKKFLNATFYEIRIWSKALTVEEISSTSFNTKIRVKGIVGYWNFNKLDVDKIRDRSGYNRDLVVKKIK